MNALGWAILSVLRVEEQCGTQQHRRANRAIQADDPQDPPAGIAHRHGQRRRLERRDGRCRLHGDRNLSWPRRVSAGRGARRPDPRSGTRPASCAPPVAAETRRTARIGPWTWRSLVRAPSRLSRPRLRYVPHAQREQHGEDDDDPEDDLAHQRTLPGFMSPSGSSASLTARISRSSTGLL